MRQRQTQIENVDRQIHKQNEKLDEKMQIQENKKWARVGKMINTDVETEMMRQRYRQKK